MALGLHVGNPLPDTQINIGEALAVTGLVTGTGFPEPNFIRAVTVQLGDQSPVPATLKLPSHFPYVNSVPVWTFVADLQVTVPSGPNAIVVEAIFDRGEVQARVPVIASSPGAPLTSTFRATATLKTSHSFANGPFTNSIVIETMFSGDLETVMITNFSPISHTVSTPLGDDTITVTLIGGGIGKFALVSSPSPGPGGLPVVRGAMTIPVTLNFHHSNNLIGGDSTLSLIFTTGNDRSPTGAFTDTGTLMDATGAIVLVGDGSFQGGFFGSSDASLVLAGTFSPVPLPVSRPLP